MPALAEWLCHYPADWTPRQAKAYQGHVLQQLVQGMLPCLQALGPTQTVGILLAVTTMIVQRNPIYARDICTILANTFEQIESLDPLAEATVQ